MTVKPKSPTVAAVNVWDALDRITAKKKMPPTIREIMNATGSNSTSATLYKLERGIKANRVARIEAGASRCYVPAWWIKMIRENMRNYYNV